MPTAPVDDEGTVLYFEDSGRPGESGDYTTLVLGHGAVFHGAGFRGMIPYAAKNNLRLVLVNWRDYVGSSLHTPAELDKLRSSKREDQASVIQTLGLELLGFLRWFTETEKIPEIDVGTDGSRTGGIAVLGWSAGNIPVLSALAHANAASRETRCSLGKYFRSAVLYDPSFISIGLPAVDGIYEPLFSSGVTPEEGVTQFPIWVSSYWTPVDDVLSGQGKVIPHPIIPLLKSRVAMHESDTGATWTMNDYKPTILHLEPDALANLADPAVLERSQMAIFRVNPSVFMDNLHTALLPESYLPEGEAMTWPHLKINHVWCDMTVADCVWAAQYIHDLYESRTTEWRPFQMHKLEGANHFAHWDDPERFTGFLAKII